MPNAISNNRTVENTVIFFGDFEVDDVFSSNSIINIDTTIERTSINVSLAGTVKRREVASDQGQVDLMAPEGHDGIIEFLLVFFDFLDVRRSQDFTSVIVFEVRMVFLLGGEVSDVPQFQTLVFGVGDKVSAVIFGGDAGQAGDVTVKDTSRFIIFEDSGVPNFGGTII